MNRQYVIAMIVALFSEFIACGTINQVSTAFKAKHNSKPDPIVFAALKQHCSEYGIYDDLVDHFYHDKQMHFVQFPVDDQFSRCFTAIQQQCIFYRMIGIPAQLFLTHNVLDFNFRSFCRFETHVSEGIRRHSYTVDWILQVKDLEPLQPLLIHPKLEAIFLDNFHIEQDGVKFVVENVLPESNIQWFTAIIHLDSELNSLPLFRSLMQTPLRKLKLYRSKVLKNEILAVEYVQVLADALTRQDSPLQDLSLNTFRIGEQNAGIFFDALPDSNLKKLEISKDQFGREGGGALAAALPKSPLTQLRLRDCHLSRKGIMAIFRALSKVNRVLVPLKAIFGASPKAALNLLELTDTSMDYETIAQLSSSSLDGRLEFFFSEIRRGYQTLTTKKSDPCYAKYNKKIRFHLFHGTASIFNPGNLKGGEQTTCEFESGSESIKKIINACCAILQ